MFDYQAGEKYKLTLIMVAIAGMLAGMFFTVLLMPTPEAAPRRRQPPAWANNPDVTGAPMTDPGSTQEASAGGAGGEAAQGGPAQMATDAVQARDLVVSFLPLAWDLSAFSARAHQEQAISLMTDECKHAYTSHIWTPEIAQQIESSGVQSEFQPKKVEPTPMKSDGSVEVIVEGVQTLGVAGKGQKTRNVKVAYLVKQFPEGLKIAGISELSQNQ